MRNLHALTFVLVTLLSTAAIAQTTTTTILVEYEPLNGACGAHLRG